MIISALCVLTKNVQKCVQVIQKQSLSNKQFLKYWSIKQYGGCDYMAIPTSIKTLLSGDVVEWARIELKQTWDPAASLKTICAFANDLDNWGGGYIIGVQEVNGRPIYPLKGVQPEKLDSFQKSIFAKCKLLRPSYTPIISVEKYQDKYFIVIWCPGGDNRPYSSPKTMERNDQEKTISN